jgi:hypothetical protein
VRRGSWKKRQSHSSPAWLAQRAALHGFAWSMQEDTWTGFPCAVEPLTRLGGLASLQGRSQFVEEQESSINNLSSHPGGIGPKNRDW